MNIEWIKIYIIYVITYVYFSGKNKILPDT